MIKLPKQVKDIDRIFKTVGFDPDYPLSLVSKILNFTHTKYLADGQEPYKVSLPLEKDAAEDDLQYYTVNGYDVMNNDVHRNEWYHTAISNGSNLGYHEWFEIGPGASATLSKMVMESHPQNTLLAIEANPASASSASSILGQYGTDRSLVVRGLAGETDLPTNMSKPNALVAEILGHFASSEGYVYILNAIRRYQLDIHFAVPQNFGTRFVPVDVSRVSEKVLDLAKVGPRIIQFNRFPFKATQLSDSHGIMEDFDTMSILRNSIQGPESFTSSVVISNRGTLDGIAFYIYFFNDGIGESTSNADLPMPSTNWLNLMLPIGDVEVFEYDILTVHTTVGVDRHSVTYVYDIDLTRNDRVIWKGQRHWTYDDILGNEGTIQECLRYFKIR
jgi:hypothetical protein